MTSEIAGWVNRHARICLWGLAILALVLRALLVAFSPWSFGYVWDLYHEAIQHLYRTGRLPVAADCWECWQPPLLFLAAWPLYALGKIVYPVSAWPDDHALRFAGAIPIVCGLTCLLYTYRLLRLMGQRGGWLVIGFGLAAAVPCLFFSTYGLEPDIVMAALVIAFLYYLTRLHVAPGAATALDIVRLGALTGLAAETKYSGVTAAVAGTIVLASDAWRARAIRGGVRTIVAFLLVAVAIGSWKYVDNVRRYGTPFYANGPALTGFRLSARALNTQYEFTTFRLGALIALTKPDAPPGMLTTLPVYRSVWTTLHGLAWGDMGFFSNPTRHGTEYPFYRDRHVAPWLASFVLVLGVVPDLLAVVGWLITLRRRAYLPISVMWGVGWLLYAQYMLSQEIWALKTKYVLFLLPAYALYAVVGLRWVRAVLPDGISAAIVCSTIVLTVLANLYLLSFALG